jgi:hypothetical protein
MKNLEFIEHYQINYCVWFSSVPRDPKSGCCWWLFCSHGADWGEVKRFAAAVSTDSGDQRTETGGVYWTICVVTAERDRLLTKISDRYELTGEKITY